MSDSAYMPDGWNPDTSTPEGLLDAYVFAEGWVEGSSSVKQGRAWEKRRDILRATLLERIK